MRIYDLRDEEGRVVAFEVPNMWLGRRGALRVIRAIAGARITRRPHAFTLFAEEDFCEFTLGDVTFGISAPFGDNSRYWIGPLPVLWCPEVEAVRAAFAAAGPFGLWASRAVG